LAGEVHLHDAEVCQVNIAVLVEVTKGPTLWIHTSWSGYGRADIAQVSHSVFVFVLGPAGVAFTPYDGPGFTSLETQATFHTASSCVAK
jgi:hypothetical protein